MEKSEVNISCVEADDTNQDKAKQETPQIDHVVEAWPKEPKDLSLAPLDQLIYTIIDGALIALPVLLMVKIGLCIYAHHLDRYNTGNRIDSASRLSRVLVNFNGQLVTLFTIVFVTIVSTFVRRFALWKAQRGAYVTDLEQLQGSISLPSTLKLVWSLRSFGLKSILLVLVWSFYYLGSQAVKLEYQLSLSTDFQSMKVAIQRPDAVGYFSPNLTQAYDNSHYKNPNDENESASSGITPLKTTDTYFKSILLDLMGMNGKEWGKVNPGTNNGPLIPDYYTFLGKIGQENVIDTIRRKYAGWIDTSHRSTTGEEEIPFVSFSGTTPSFYHNTNDAKNPTQNYPDDRALLGSYTQNHIGFLNVSCGGLTVLPLSSFPGTDPDVLVSMNMTTPRLDAPKDLNGKTLREFTWSLRGNAIDPTPSGTLPDDCSEGVGVDGCSVNMTQRTLQSICSVSVKYVDMQVSCLASGCFPLRIRWSNNTSEFNATSHSTPFDDNAFALNFFDGYSRQSSGDMQGWEDIQTYNELVWSTLGAADGPSIGANDILDAFETSISQYLSRFFNTYHALSQMAISVPLRPNITRLEDNKPDDFFQLVDFKGAVYEQAYRIYWVWIPIDFIACAILLAAAVGSYWLRVHTLAPDIFGFVSSLTRGNPHIQLPSEGSTLNGIERARMLKKVKVKFGNVQEVTAENGPVGTVGLAPVQAGVQPLRPAHVYQ